MYFLCILKPLYAANNCGCVGVNSYRLTQSHIGNFKSSVVEFTVTPRPVSTGSSYISATNSPENNGKL